MLLSPHRQVQSTVATRASPMGVICILQAGGLWESAAPATPQIDASRVGAGGDKLSRERLA